MTMVDGEAPLSRWVEEAPRIAVFDRTAEGNVELYVYCYGQRLSLIPKTGEELLLWIIEYLDNPVKALETLGLELPDRPIIRSADDLLSQLNNL